MDELIPVACAILKNGEKIFAAKRSTPYSSHFSPPPFTG